MKKLLALFLTITFIASLNSASAEDIAKASNTATGRVLDSIKSALTEKGISGKLKVSINGYENGFKLRDELDSYKISTFDININEKTHFFKADVAITASDTKTRHYNVTGSYDEIVSIPVLAKKMPRDTVVKETDISWLEVPHEQVKFEVISDKEKIIGKALKREISDNTPIKEQDLQKEQILSRNATVNILFTTPTISIKTIGITLDNGGIGDTIRVRNSTSNKIIQAVIQDDQNVAALNLNNNLIRKTAKVEDKIYVR